MDVIPEPSEGEEEKTLIEGVPSCIGSSASSHMSQLLPIQEQHPLDLSFRSMIQRKKKRTCLISLIIFGVLCLVGILIVAFIFALRPKESKKEEEPQIDYDNPYEIQEIKYSDDYTVRATIINTRPIEELTQDNASNPEIERLSLEAHIGNNGVLGILLTDEENYRYRAPIVVNNSKCRDEWVGEHQPMSLKDYGFSYTYKPFEYSLSIQETTALSTQYLRLKYFDKYIEVNYLIKSIYIYGMGERVHNLTITDGVYTVWNYARYCDPDDGKPPGKNMYGSHPFILAKLSEHLFIGMYMNNMNAMDFSIYRFPNGTSQLKYIMVGGVVDMRIFTSATPEGVIKVYHNMIGRSYLPPFWSMGYHQSRWGYNDLGVLKAVVDKFREHKIPLDAIYLDIDIMKDYQIFSVDGERFPHLKSYTEELRANGTRLVTIIDPGVTLNSTFKYYEVGIDMKVFIKSAYTLTPLVGKSRPGAVVFPDFFHPNISEYWLGGLEEYISEAGFSGLWLDLNEITNLCPGECPLQVKMGNMKGTSDTTRNTRDTRNISSSGQTKRAKEYDERLIYTPGEVNLNTLTISMSALHYGALYPRTPEEATRFEYNTHNLYGIMEAIITKEYLEQKLDERPYVLAVSNYVGIGHFATHLLGDNYSKWSQLRFSIPGILNFNMFGVNHVGADICGYTGNATDELCGRWFQLGAFYPFSRAHSRHDAKPHNEPWNFGDTTLEVAKASLYLRYSILKFMYTSIWITHLYGGTVVQPLFFHFPGDDTLYKEEFIQECFLIGNQILVASVLDEGKTELGVYLPNYNWYKLGDMTLVNTYNNTGSTGKNITLASDMTKQKTAHLLVMGGSIISFQDAAKHQVQHTGELNNMSLTIKIFADHLNQAVGELIIDDGITPNPSTDNYTHYQFLYSYGLIKIEVLGDLSTQEVYEIERSWEIELALKYREDIDIEVPNFVYCILKNTTWIQLPHKVEDEILHIENGGAYLNEVESIIFGDQSRFNPVNSTIYISNITNNTDNMLSAHMFTNLTTNRNKEYDLRAMVVGDGNILSLQMVDKENNNSGLWVVPGVVPDNFRKPAENGNLRDFQFKMSGVGEELKLEITQEDSVNWIMRSERIIMEDNYIELKMFMRAQKIVGLESEKMLSEEGVYGLYMKGTTEHTENRENREHRENRENTDNRDNIGMYSLHTHPFYMIETENNKYMGIFVLTSTPAEIKIEGESNIFQVSHMLTSNLLDIFICKGDTPQELLKTYHKLIGGSRIIPYWGLGYHHSKYNHSRTLSDIESMVSQFNKSQIPLDCIWEDYEYMDQGKSFTIDTDGWKGMREYVEEVLTPHNLHFMPVIHSAISSPVDNPHIFIKQHTGSNIPLLGMGLGGYSKYIDFYNPEGALYYQKLLMELCTQFPYDGIWIDMALPTNLCDGECSETNYTSRHLLQRDIKISPYTMLLYTPALSKFLSRQSISEYSIHTNGSSVVDDFHYRPLNTLNMGRASSQVFLNLTKQYRGLVLASSSYPGVGYSLGGYLGGSWNTWGALRQTITFIFKMQYNAITFAGVDICGYYIMGYDDTLELCTRWMQLASMQPLLKSSKNHSEGALEPYQDHIFEKLFKNSMALRYSLLRYIYTIHMIAAMEVNYIYIIYREEFTSVPYFSHFQMINLQGVSKTHSCLEKA